MPPPSAASSSASSSSSARQKKRRWTRSELMHSLELLIDIPPPLSHNLPLSPPCSRPSSPVPGNKRKSDSLLDSEHVKRPRTTSVSERTNPQQVPPPHQLPPPHLSQPSTHPSAGPSQPPVHLRTFNPIPVTASSSRSEPCEDGEVREDPPHHTRGSAANYGVLPPNAVPIRRPKRGKPTIPNFDRLHDRYHNAGRMLKYSGDARFWSTYPPTHKEYRPLPDPPPVNSPYHKHGGLIARLELVDALVCFTYSIWARDYCRKTCAKDTWTTIEAFLTWCKAKWQAEDAINDAEKAFIGLIYTIEAFINGRKMLYGVRSDLDQDINKVTEQARSHIETAIQEVDQGTVLGGNAGILSSKSQGTPPMLPSPASIAPTNSANSTPTTREGSTPNIAVRPASTQQNLPPRQTRPVSTTTPAFFHLLPRKVRESPVPPPESYLEAASKVTEPIDINMICSLKELTSTYKSSAASMLEAQNTLNLPIMACHFPRTFARMVYSTLSHNEEHEPDFEDEEGELFWPGQLITGEGLGWVCLMGKAMIKEFGKAYGYNGLDGVVPKPKPEDTAKLPHHSSSQRPTHPLPPVVSHSSSNSGPR